MSSEHDFKQTTSDENFNKTFRGDLPTEKLLTLQNYFEALLEEMKGQRNNANVKVSRDSLENISKTLHSHLVIQTHKETASAIHRAQEKEEISTIRKVWSYFTEKPIPSGIILFLVIAGILHYFPLLPH